MTPVVYLITMFCGAIVFSGLIIFLCKYSIKSCPKCGKHRVVFQYTSIDNHHNQDYHIYTCNNCNCQFAIHVHTGKLHIRN